VELAVADRRLRLMCFGQVADGPGVLDRTKRGPIVAVVDVVVTEPVKDRLEGDRQRLGHATNLVGATDTPPAKTPCFIGLWRTFFIILSDRI
jgi:hypothetical protein